MPAPDSQRSNRNMALSLVALVAGMVMLTYATVPLYDLFCKVTGFGGTPQLADAAPSSVPASERVITVRLNADIASDLPWDFKPVQNQQQLKIGEEKLMFYTAENLADTATSGVAIYNVTPHAAAPYFAKMECFCFNDQTLQPGSKVNMPVSFFIDPSILDDPYLKDLQTVTLSYTFFKSKNSP